MHDRARVRNVMVVGLAALALVAASCGDDDSGDATSTSEVPVTNPTTTTIAPATGVVWPVEGSVTYDDPVEAVTRFAVDFVGFADPVVGNFQAADGTGMVEVRPAPNGPVTTV